MVPCPLSLSIGLLFTVWPTVPAPPYGRFPSVQGVVLRVRLSSVFFARAASGWSASPCDLLVSPAVAGDLPKLRSAPPTQPVSVDSGLSCAPAAGLALPTHAAGAALR